MTSSVLEVWLTLMWAVSIFWRSWMIQTTNKYFKVWYKMKRKLWRWLQKNSIINLNRGWKYCTKMFTRLTISSLVIFWHEEASLRQHLKKTNPTTLMLAFHSLLNPMETLKFLVLLANFKSTLNPSTTQLGTLPNSAKIWTSKKLSDICTEESTWKWNSLDILQSICLYAWTINKIQSLILSVWVAF